MSQPGSASRSGLHVLQANGQLEGAAAQQLPQQHAFLVGESFTTGSLNPLDGPWATCESSYTPLISTDYKRSVDMRYPGPADEGGSTALEQAAMSRSLRQSLTRESR
jgi:hypothetical protein